MTRPSRQRGLALVLVMWISVILAVIAASFILERRSEHLIVLNSQSMARAEAAADAGVHRGLLDLFRPNDPEVWKRDGSVHEWAFEGVPVRVELSDESARIDINTASDPLILGLFLSIGIPHNEAVALVDALLDWRDGDPLKRPNGAEEADYRAAGLPYLPANAPFQAIQELQLVLGMRPEIYSRLAPSITVLSRLPGVNPQLANREVLLAIPGITPEQVDEYIAQREHARAQKLPIPAFVRAGAFASTASMVASIRSDARLEDGTVFVREAVALLRPVPRQPVTFVAWRESTAAPAAPKPPLAEAR